MAVYSYTDAKGVKRWRADLVIGYDLDGKPDRRSPSFPTKKQAQQAEIELRILKEGLRGRSDKMTFSDFVEKYYLPIKEKSLRKNTVQGYKSVINNHLMPTLGNIRLCAINRMQIQSLLSSRSSYKVAKNTRDVLRQILGEAMQMEAISSNPAAGRFKLPENKGIGKNYGAVVSSFAEHQRIIALADGHTKAILVLGLCFGLRKGEILGLDWSDIDFKARTININRTYTYTRGRADLTPPKTPESVRVIPMSGFAYNALKELQGDIPHIGAVVTGKHGRLTPDAASKLVRRFVSDNDVPKISIMSLRHSFATASILAGMDVAKLAKILGHTNITTTFNRYVRPLQDDLQSAMDIVDTAYLAAK